MNRVFASSVLTEGENGVFLGEVVRDGQRAVMAIVCRPTRVRLSGAFAMAMWQREGARGTISDVAYPDRGETTEEFLRVFDAMKVKTPCNVSGSEDAVMRILTKYYDRERDRVRRG